MKNKRVWRQLLLTVGIVVLCGAVITLVIADPLQLAGTNELPASLRPFVVVDAGHGDFDGGAIAPDGTAEKDINLAIASPLGMMLTLCGFDVTMTREDDSALHADDSASIRNKKVSDMKRRLELFDEANINVSIHQNSFGASQYYGAQVFYSENHPLSKPLGAAVREEIYRLLQPENTRELKTGNRDIYLLYKTTSPTILVECGFLSNASELEQLKNTDYQRQMAFAVACGVTRYACENAV